MQVKVKLFAILRERAGQSELLQEIGDDSTIGELWQNLRKEHSGLAAVDIKLLYAVNGDYVEPDHVLRDGDEVVFVPPVSGGC